MINALWITLIGMGLVFVAILLLWGLMALLVRLTASPENAEPPVLEVQAAAGGDASQAELPEDVLAMDRKRRAAVAAVAAALALQKAKGKGHESAQPLAPISPWLAAHRANQLNRQNQAPRKKVFR